MAEQNDPTSHKTDPSFAGAVTDRTDTFRSFGVFPGTKMFRLSLCFVLAVTFLYCLHVLVESDERKSVFLTEDGIVEYTTAVLFLAAFILLVLAARRSSFSRNYRIFTALAAVALFVIAMEEISWGQRIFGWGTGGWFGDTNAQNETNLHNADTEFTHWAFWGGTLLLGALIPYAYLTIGIARKWIEKLDFPVMSPDLSVFFLLPFLFSATGSDHKLKQVIELAALCSIPLVLLRFRFSGKFVDRLPPGWGRHLPLLLPAVGIPLFWVHELFLRHYRNPALEMREVLIAFAFFLFAVAEFRKSTISKDGLPGELSEEPSDEQPYSPSRSEEDSEPF